MIIIMVLHSHMCEYEEVAREDIPYAGMNVYDWSGENKVE